jgi:hypothetical protein
MNNMAKKKSKDDPPASELIDQYIADHEDWRGVLIARIRELIHEADPNIVEEWKWMGSPVYSHNGIVVVTNAHKNKVKVTFNQGANLEDPNNLFNAGLDGNKWRAIDLFEGDELDETAFKELIEVAVNYNIQKSK